MRTKLLFPSRRPVRSGLTTFRVFFAHDIASHELLVAGCYFHGEELRLLPGGSFRYFQGRRLSLLPRKLPLLLLHPPIIAEDFHHFHCFHHFNGGVVEAMDVHGSWGCLHGFHGKIPLTPWKISPLPRKFEIVKFPGSFHYLDGKFLRGKASATLL